jgi:FixJ family two-component response regulator
VAHHPIISIVDDDESVREALRGFIRSVGFTANVFASAEEFLAWPDLRTTDCLIIDVRMPGMNGLELHRRLLADHHQIPVIFMTAYLEEDVRSRALGNGAVAFLLKPFSDEALLNTIKTSVKRNTGGQ